MLSGWIFQRLGSSALSAMSARPAILPLPSEQDPGTSQMPSRCSNVPILVLSPHCYGPQTSSSEVHSPQESFPGSHASSLSAPVHFPSNIPSPTCWSGPSPEPTLPSFGSTSQGGTLRPSPPPVLNIDPVCKAFGCLRPQVTSFIFPLGQTLALARAVFTLDKRVCWETGYSQKLPRFF